MPLLSPPPAEKRQRLESDDINVTDVDDEGSNNNVQEEVPPDLKTLLGEDGILVTMLSFIETPKVVMMRRVSTRWYKCSEMALAQQTKKAFTSNMELRDAIRHYGGWWMSDSSRRHVQYGLGMYRM
jgi:hypothetical protein